MKYRTNAFRIVLMLSAVIFFFVGVHQLEKSQVSYGMYNIALAVGSLAFSNVLDPEKKTTISDAIEGRTRWAFTPFGSVLYLAYLLLCAISLWLWFKYG